jgi:hypothetical protein
VYETLVGSLAPVIDRVLCGGAVLYGPRGRNRVPRWLSFERSVLRDRHRYVVVADVADFYACIGHATLMTTLHQAGADSRRVEALAALLKVFMSGNRGLPQGFRASRALATVYLNSLDRAMVDRGWAYARCEDDFRIGVHDSSTADRALGVLDEELAAVGLQLRVDKTRVMDSNDYEMRLPRGAPWEVWMWWRIAPVLEGGVVHRRIAPVSDRALRWLRSRGGGRKRAQDVIVAALEEPHLNAGEEEDVCRVVAAALTILGATRSPVVADVAEPLLHRFPSESPLVARCLVALLRTPARVAAQTVVEGALLEASLAWPAQEAWLYWALRPVAGSLSEGAVLRKVASTVGSTTAPWVCRVQAAWVLDGCGQLDPTSRRALATTAPAPLRSSLPP